MPLCFDSCCRNSEPRDKVRVAGDERCVIHELLLFGMRVRCFTSTACRMIFCSPMMTALLPSPTCARHYAQLAHSEGLVLAHHAPASLNMYAFYHRRHACILATGPSADRRTRGSSANEVFSELQINKVTRTKTSVAPGVHFRIVSTPDLATQEAHPSLQQSSSTPAPIETLTTICLGVPLARESMLAQVSARAQGELPQASGA